MRFLHAGVHRQRYRELTTLRPIYNQGTPEPFEIRCPTCGTVYVAGLSPTEEWPDLVAVEHQAVAALAAECPDHPHFFNTEP
jgi:hypothetical protein